ncbi:S-adenosyl-L-methionine-dependent methyltransferase [Scheffersomyces coipomensis]|uniref:S-adenosyl-L-methionine-dependent methyltransferase n=1 Tax=Scheffersomyces coipomensis TaxID=1788519 RepID=UPI00315DCD4D
MSETNNNHNSHQEAIIANLKQFDSEFASKYDLQETTTVLSLLFSKTLLEFNPLNLTRKTIDESEPVLGDPTLPNNGFTLDNTLPPINTFSTKFPHSIFKPGMKLLDFACGTGIVTTKLIPYLIDEKHTTLITEVVGIDVNEAFLNKFNEKFIHLNQEQITINSYIYDILNPKFESELRKFNHKFDAIICTISYHHLDNYRDVTKKLVEFLTPGGWIFIIDFYNEDVDHINTKSSTANQAVRHMGGLKLSSLNETLGDYCQLHNVSSAREFKSYIWQPSRFIHDHCPQSIIDKYHKGELPSKLNESNDELFCIESSIVMAVGQKGK